ncbi:MAG: substrate-binding domain-containing protein [Polyangiaceae bacterium]
MVPACGSDDHSAKTQEKVTIGWMAKGATNTFFDLSRHAAQLAAQDLASASGREVEVVLLDAQEATADAQAAQVQAAIDMGVDALDISVLDPAVLTPVLDKAVDAGIPVLTFDSDAPASKRTSFYGISNLAGAQSAASILSNLMGQKGKIAIMTAAGSTPGTLSTSQTYTERMSGFLDSIAANPDLEVVATIPCGKTEETNYAGCTGLLEEQMAAHPDITGWYLARGRALREAKLETLAPNWSAAVKAGTVKVVAFDLPQDALHSVQDGLVNAVVTQDYFGWGYDVVNLSFDVLTIGRPLDAFTDSKFDVVCANNIGQLTNMWAAQDFRSPLDACDLPQ